MTIEWVTNLILLLQSLCIVLSVGISQAGPGEAADGEVRVYLGVTSHLNWAVLLLAAWCAAGWSQLAVCMSVFIPFVPALVLPAGHCSRKAALAPCFGGSWLFLVGHYHSYEDRLALQRCSSLSCWLPKGLEFVFESCTESMAEGQAAAWR